MKTIQTACFICVFLGLACTTSQKPKTWPANSRPRLILPSICATYAPPALPKSEFIHALMRRGNLQEQYQVLKTTAYFADTGVGVGGEAPENLIAHRALFVHPQAREMYELLFSEAGQAGKLYALGGLFLKDYCSFYSKAILLQDSHDQVVWASGCTAHSLPLSEILYRPDATLRLTGVDTDACKKFVGTPAQIVDFVGGSIPLSLVSDEYCQAGSEKK